jgi:multidrug efflux pump subunit AcrB
MSAGVPRALNISTRCRMPDLDELNEWAPRLLASAQEATPVTRCGLGPADNGTMVSLNIDRDQAARFGIQPALIDNTLYDAFGQREVTQYFTQLNSYHVVLEVTRVCRPTRYAEQDLRQVAHYRPTGAAVDLRQVRY